MKEKEKRSKENVIASTGKFFQDFKNFAFKKNIVDLAVAVIIGTAFNKIVTSLVNDLVMPFFSLLLGTQSFSDLKIILMQATETTSEVAIHYGSFLQSLVDFLIIAFSIFITLRMIEKSQKALEKAIDKIDGIEGNLKSQSPALVLTKDQELLTEILKALKKEETKKEEE